jgi:hypothetical protein
MTDNPDPFGGGPENWSLPDPEPRPPTDAAGLEDLDRWMDEREAATAETGFDRPARGDIG